MTSEPAPNSNEWFIREARIEYEDGNRISIDAEPALSHADEGAWVAAWVWVPRAEVDEDCHEDYAPGVER